MGVMGTVYLLHFDPPLYRDARTKGVMHYTGFTTDLTRRMTEHLSGHGSDLMRAVAKSGATVTIARTWVGDRATERRLKDGRRAARLCPICCGEKGSRPERTIRMPLTEGEEHDRVGDDQSSPGVTG